MKKKWLNCRFKVLVLCFTFHMITATVSAEMVTIVYAQDYAPFSWQDKQTQQVRGVLVDFIEEILHKRIKLQISHKIYPWK